MLEMNTGGGVRPTVFQPGMDTMPAWNFREAEFIEADIVAAKIGTVCAGWFIHRITSMMIIEFITL